MARVIESYSLQTVCWLQNNGGSFRQKLDGYNLMFAVYKGWQFKKCSLLTPNFRAPIFCTDAKKGQVERVAHDRFGAGICK